MGNGRSYRSTTIEKISFEVLKEEAEEDGTLMWMEEAAAPAYY